jgi:hypothetical protein
MQQQPTPGPDTRSPRGGLKDAAGGAADGGRTAPGPAEGLNVGVGAMGASNDLKESCGVNGSGGRPRVSSRWVVSCFVCGLVSYGSVCFIIEGGGRCCCCD